ncbi:MAG TPA: tetratricopeptide repeat protein [Candidatus Obscuribacterales bacterium]
MRIGEILISASLINAHQLDEALNYAAYKQLPIGRALRILRYVAEDDLSRVVEAQKAMRKGVESRIAMELLRIAKESNRTFNYQLEHSPIALRQIPTVLIETILDKKLPRSLHEQLRAMGAPVAPAQPATKPAAAPPTPSAPPSPATPVPAKPVNSVAASGPIKISDLEKTLILDSKSSASPKPAAGAHVGQPPSKPAADIAIGPRTPVIPLPDTNAAPRQSVNIDELIEQGDQHYAANELNLAEQAYRKARLHAEEAYSVRPSRVAAVLTKLANLYLGTDRFADAQPLYARILEINQKLFGAGTPQVTRSLEDLCELYELQGNTLEAKRYIEEALKNFYQQERLDIDVGARLLKHLLTLTRKANLGEQQQRTRIGELAVDAHLITRDQLQSALQTAQKTGAPLGAVLRSQQLLDSQQVESLMFAQVMIKQGTLPANVAVHAIKLAAQRKVPLRQFIEAGKFMTDRELNKDQYQQVVLEQEKMLAAEGTLGADHLEVARIAQRIADLHVERKDWLAAEAMYKRAIAVMDKHPSARLEVARSCERLASIYCKNGKHGEAQPLLFRSLELRQAGGEGETIDAANTLWELARIELSQFNQATALSFLRTARSIFEKLTPGSTPPGLLGQIYDCCVEAGLTADLEPILLQLIESAHKQNKSKDAQVAQYIERLGDIYLSAGRMADAQTQFQFALAVQQQAGAQNKVEALCKKLSQLT